MERRSLLGEYRTADGSPALPDGNGVRASLLDEYEPIQPSLLDDYQDTPSLLDEYRPGEAIGEVVGAGLSGSGGIDLRDDPIIRAQLEKWGAYESIPLTESLPRVAAAGLGIAVPASIPAQVVGGLLLSSAARGTTAALEGEDVLAAANPLNNKMESLLDVAIPVGTGAITRGMRAPKLDEALPDYAKATSANADLPPRHEVLTAPTADDVPIGSVEPQTGWQRLRQYTMNPKRYLMRADDPGVDAPPSTERIAGETLEGYRSLREQIQQQGENEIRLIEEGLTKSQRRQVGLILDGKLEPTAVDTPVLDAVSRARRFLDELGTRGEGAGMLTRSEETGELLPFAKREGDYFPHRLLDEGEDATVSLSSRGGRKYRIDPTQKQRLDKQRKYEMDVGKQLRTYLDDFSRDVSASYHFGPRTEGVRWGENADNIWRNLVAENKPLSAAAFESRMDVLMNPDKMRNPGKVLQAIQRGQSKLALPSSAITSWTQAGTNVARAGVSNTIEGMTRWLRDPSMKKLYESSGALNPGFTEMAMEGGTRPTLGSRWMARTERGLRGFMNAGTVPYAEKVIAKVQAGDRSRTTLRQLRELGIELAEAEKGPSADLMRRVVQKSSDDLQLQAHDPINAGEVFDSPEARTFLAYMQYPAEAARLAHDMVLDPVVKGARNLDPREAALGIGRGARWLGGAGAGAAAAELARSAMQGREPDPMNVVYNTADTIAGLPAAPITALMRGFDPTKSVGQAPFFSLAGQSIKSAGQLAGDNPERGAMELALDLAATLDPTGSAALARQIGRAQIREAYR